MSFVPNRLALAAAIAHGKQKVSVRGGTTNEKCGRRYQLANCRLEDR
jgi:hypothetical protein